MMIHKPLHLLLAIALSLWIATPAWAGYAEGKAAFDRADYSTAYDEFRPLAESEDVNAQYYIGLLNRNGWGIEQDDREAAKWMRLAANQDLVEAQYVLGYMYQHGQGVSSDIDEAKRWYRMAAKAGDTDAQQSLEIIYYEEQRALKAQRGDQGGFIMSADSGDWFDTVLGLLIGLEETMTVGDILLIAAVILIIVVPVIMPFSFYRIKPMLQDISDQGSRSQ